ncbi:T3SS effector HopA1 family protein [Streptomyces sp. NPDC014734]|uniref:T3SS effector HopA1 family protein n=1 Tax=Streptomyces sp. NPDC014734 TaxID=3364886 RepID=UPI0036FACB85
MSDRTEDVLSARLVAVLSEVVVRPDGLSASVGGRTVTADSPRTLVGRLATALYEVVHVGRPAVQPEETRNAPDIVRDLEAGLAREVPHERTRYRGPVLSDRGDEGRIVGLSGVRVRVPRERIAAPHAAAATAAAGTSASAAASAAAAGTSAGASAGASVDVGAREPTSSGEETADVFVAAARPALSPGFFLVDGSLPLTGRGAVLRVYLHVTSPDAAVDAWGRSLRCLEEAGVPYRAKAISSTDALPRRDGVVIYLEGSGHHVLPDLVGAVGEAALGADCSPYTRSLAPGIAVAWEPDDSRPGMRNTSFGEHRSRALATGLIRYATEADLPDRTRSAVVRQALLDAGIDPSEPARNLFSPPFKTVP